MEDITRIKAEWQPIATAPKDGTEILGWREAPTHWMPILEGPKPGAED